MPGDKPVILVVESEPRKCALVVKELSQYHEVRQVSDRTEMNQMLSPHYAGVFIHDLEVLAGEDHHDLSSLYLNGIQAIGDVKQCGLPLVVVNPELEREQGHIRAVLDRIRVDTGILFLQLGYNPKTAAQDIARFLGTRVPNVS